jgi:hypothetical protein
MWRSSVREILWVAIALVAPGIPAFGDSFTFDFTSLTYVSSNTGNEAASITTQLNAELHTVCPACSVTVLSGSKAGNPNSLGAVVDEKYNGEGFAVGPTSSSGSNVISETLGDTPANATITSNSQYTYSALNTQGYTNKFLSNTTDSGSHEISNEISLQFTGLTIESASFNYEIFPDNGSQGTADFTFEAGNNQNGVDPVIFHQLGLTPSSSGNGDGTDSHSPNSGTGSPETNVQYIGNWSGTLAPSTELDFVDWPATIAIDNLKITWGPEPGSIILLGTVVILAGLLVKRRRSQQT